jgi:hypothetical protein
VGVSFLGELRAIWHGSYWTNIRARLSRKGIGETLDSQHAAGKRPIEPIDAALLVPARIILITLGRNLADDVVRVREPSCQTERASTPKSSHAAGRPPTNGPWCGPYRPS